MGIWKDLLLKTVKGEQFKNAKTISPLDYSRQFQVFEVLVTETLAIVDPTTEWHSLPVQGDDGIDFIGQIQQVNVPYLISKPNEVVLGQVKRRAGSYTKDNFRYDIIKIIEYYNEQYSQQMALFEIIHVLSTDKNINPSKWVENIKLPYSSYNILPVNAIDFLKFWKINPTFLQMELEGIFSQEQLSPLLEYINNLQEKWDDLIQTNIEIGKFICMDDDINIKVSFSSSVDITLTLYLEWVPSEEDSNIAVIYPSNIVKNAISRYAVSIYKKLDLTIRLKSIRAGIQDLGNLNIYSSSGELIFSKVLGRVEVHTGLTNKFFSLPCEVQLKEVKEHLLNNDIHNYKAYSLMGQGGIGKSRLSQEIAVFAQNRKYYTISIQNANDFSNSRNIILDMLIKILDMQNIGLISYENIYTSLRQKLGINFMSDWNQPILNYVTNSDISDGELEKVAKCILTLFIIQLHNQAIFIWLSDMHWATKETFGLFKKILDLLRLNKDYLNHSLTIIFEGRDSDTLEVDETVIFPYNWLEFCENENIEKVKISAWGDNYSKDFIQMLINPMRKPENANRNRLLSLVENHASGNPMHIKELLHYLIESENVLVEEDGTLTLINPIIRLTPKVYGIREIILKRIHFYQKRYSDVIDYYIILATLCHNLPDIYDYTKHKLSKKYINYPLLEKDIGIISDTKTEKIFLHEFYKELLKEQFIQDEAILLDVLKYYQKNCCNSINEQLDIVRLQLMRENTNFNWVSHTLFNLLQQDLSDYQALNCYQFMLKIPQKFRSNLILSEIFFEMSEIAIRIGSWRDSQKYLEKIIALKHIDEKEELFYILACKNLGNMYGVGLELRKSLAICEVGIKEVENKLSDCTFKNDQMNFEFHRQYEMLLNRIAVTYWFAGQASASAFYQEKALQLATERNDTYSIAHTLYETGMRQLHQNVALGNNNIKRALNLLPVKDKYTELQEHYLIKVELLISQLLIYETDQHNDALLAEITENSNAICKELSVGNANYESALCHIVNAICYIFHEDYDMALRRFFTSLDCSNLGEFDTLRWKLYLNIAETYLLLYEQNNDELLHEKAVTYANYGQKILNNAIKINYDMPSYLRLVEFPALRFKKILGEHVETPQSTYSQIPICISYKNYCFYIMD